MTGHGDASVLDKDFELTVEVRSVNSRYLRVSCKVAEAIGFVQMSIEEEVKRRLSRGSVFVSVNFNPVSAADYFNIDEQVLTKYFLQLKELSQDLQTGEEIHLRDLLALPGVAQADEGRVPDRDRVQGIVMQCLSNALDRLNQMRQQEGGNLHADFSQRQDIMQVLLKTIEGSAPDWTRDYQKRVQDRIQKIVAEQDLSLSMDDLVKEVGILAERCDIVEEIARMHSHLVLFGEALEADGAVGRKMEFILQEMFREANTMASKSVNADLNRAVVEFKAELDRLKEQVQNIE
jgi:uncharacterized protein (TIGR00255 family)